uniref:Uncharacterized protein n=1 Tax=Gracilinema caldarium TaxID=215591 RepID=A0A7C3I4X1_9SPIR
MMKDKEPVIQLTLSEILTIFPRLKIYEDTLSELERDILTKMEGLLYDNLSIDELETLLKRISHD